MGKWILRVWFVCVSTLVLWGAIGCSKDHTPKGDGGAASSKDAHSNENTEIFEPPSGAYDEYQPLFERLRDEVPPGWDTVASSAFYASPSMHPNETSSEAWLRKGQKALFRYGYVGHGSSIPEGRFRIYFLVNFEPVPFGILKADAPKDSALPSDEELRELEERSRVHHYERKEGEKFGMGIVADPEVFEQGKTNEMRLLFVEDGLDDPDKHSSKYAQVNTELNGMRIHYGGESRVQFEELEETSGYTPSPLRRQYLADQPGVFVESVEDHSETLDEWEQGSGPIPDLRNMIETDRETTTVRTSLIGGPDPGIPRTYYVVRYDYFTEEFEPVGLAEDLPSYQPWLSDSFSEDLSVRFDRRIQLDPGETRATIMFQFRGWFGEDRQNRFTNNPYYKTSNTLWLHRPAN
jgi:hypothetical protein